MVLPKIVSLLETDEPLQLVDLPLPETRAGEVRIKVSVCGVCHTELDEIEGRTAPPNLPVVLGHQVVGVIDQLGDGVTKWDEGDRVGVGWIYCSSGGPTENISPDFRATGRDVNGGYAQYMIAHQDYIYRIPDVFSDQSAAPLLCAGGVGYRALKLANINDGDRLGLTGFGGSNHIVLQIARYLYPNTPIHVFARDKAARGFAMKLGAVWAGDTTDRSPQPLHAIIDTTPVWKPIIEALANLRPGGRLVINAIRKENTDQNELLDISYHEHLWLEKEIKTVANVTGNDLVNFLPIAADIPIQPQVQTYSLEQANQALVELRQGGVRGAKVLVID